MWWSRSPVHLNNHRQIKKARGAGKPRAKGYKRRRGVGRGSGGSNNCWDGWWSSIGSRLEVKFKLSRDQGWGRCLGGETRRPNWRSTSSWVTYWHSNNKCSTCYETSNQALKITPFAPPPSQAILFKVSHLFASLAILQSYLLPVASKTNFLSQLW